MEAKLDKPERTIVLPLLLVGPVEIGRLIRELLEIDGIIAEAKLKDALDKLKLPKSSKIMEQVLEINKLDLIKNHDRMVLFDNLKHIGLKSPIIHISLSSDPTPAFTEKLMDWLRREIDPQILLTLGLQPTIGAGCIVRTTNKYFDFSLRKDFLSKRDLLISKISEKDPA